MKFNTLLLTLFLLIMLSCKESQEASSTEEKDKTETTSTDDVTGTKNMEKTNPDGTINATLDCEGSSKLSSLVIASQELNTENFTCRIVQNQALTISFEDDEQDIVLSLSLHGIGILAIETGEYGNPSTGTVKYATGSIKSKTIGNFDLGNFEGHVMVTDHGMSSNVLCGSFDITDKDGNRFVGSFNEMVTSF